MGLLVPFTFRNIASACTIHIDSSATPCYVFIDLISKDLIYEFGEEITIKTDFVKLLPRQEDYPALVVLNDVIFDAIKVLPEFMAKRRLVTKLANSSVRLSTNKPGPLIGNYSV